MNDLHKRLFYTRGLQLKYSSFVVCVVLYFMSFLCRFFALIVSFSKTTNENKPDRYFYNDTRGNCCTREW